MSDEPSGNRGIPAVIPPSTDGRDKSDRLVGKRAMEGAAGRVVEEMMVGMQMSSGPAAALTALCKLPEATQLKQLENDAERTRLRFQHEEKQLAAMAADRQAERLADQNRFDKRHATAARTELLHYCYVVGITVLLSALVAGLFIAGKYELAIPVVSAGLAFGAGWVGGRTSGYSKARKEIEHEKSDDDE